jgi:hypothetical protein
MSLLKNIIRTPRELTDEERKKHPFIAKVQDKILKYKQQPTDNNNTPVGKVDTLTTEPEVVKNAPVKPTDNNNTPAVKDGTLTTEPGVVKNAPVKPTNNDITPVGKVDTLTTEPEVVKNAPVKTTDNNITPAVKDGTLTTTPSTTTPSTTTPPPPASPSTTTPSASGSSKQTKEPRSNIFNSQSQFGQQTSGQAQQQESAKAEADAKAEDDKVTAKVKKIQSDLKAAMNALTIKYNDALNNANDEEKNRISIEMEAVRNKSFEELHEVQKEIDGSNTPVVVSFFAGIFNLIKLKFDDFVGKLKLRPEVTQAQLDAVEALAGQIKKIKDEAETMGAPVDASTMGELASVLASIAKLAAAPPIPKDDDDTTSHTSIASSLQGLAPAAAAALGGAADPAALGGEKKGETEGEKKGETEGKKEGETEGKAIIPEAGPLPEVASVAATLPEVASVAAGGGISRKRSHPKYMNQVSENRNKIFKKELEIINSIRHFNRSHTIRKRDRINSILGLRKSRNNRNHGNTIRKRHEHQHKHRHNNQKHKSVKHIKK